ncbi:hypothetical protein LAZ67_5001708 [Cordylochernes scorpioides]|uniref:Uncharacterized protein n=1 Tax=Cordylochernes scorpioides TaxID=51811 RepID=A0ABY6KGL5_9ARAC|nr:hypothetical protein LAZ67_5001708 [Cordylochernes scorpioides]
MEDVSRRRREAIRGVFTEMVNDMNTELRDPLIDKSGIYAKFDKLESLHLELLALNERCQAILLAKDEATEEEIDREFGECEPYITERYYLKTRIRIMREQDRVAQVKTSQIPPGASSASPNSETDNLRVIKLQAKPKGEGVKESEVNPKDEGIKDSEDEPKGDGVKDFEDEPKSDGVKDSEAKPKDDGVKDSEDEPKGNGVNDSEARPTGDTESKIKNKGDLQKLEGNPGDWLSRWGQFGRNNANEKYEEANLNDKEDSKDEPKGDRVKDSETAIKGYESVNNSKAVAEGTDLKVEEKLNVEQGTDLKVEEKLDAEQGTDSKVEEENLDAEQGTKSKVEEKIIDPKDWFKSESRAAPIRPVFGDASCRGRSGLSLRRYLKKIPNLLRRIPEIGIKLRKNKYGVLADMRRYFQYKIRNVVKIHFTFFSNIVTGDETWAYLYESETKAQSLDWYHPSLPKGEKSKGRGHPKW